MSNSIGVIALSRFLDDPRVRRQCDLLHANGFKVFAIGEDDERNHSLGWTVVRRPESEISATVGSPNPVSVEVKTNGLVRAKAKYPVAWSLLRAAWRFSKRAAAGIARVTAQSRAKAGLVATRLLGRTPARFAQRLVITARAQRCKFQPDYADRIFWSWNSKLTDLYDKARPLKCDIWLANDWITLPIAARLAAENGGIYIYDTHEFAIQEYEERWVWRVAQKPIVAALERKYIGGAKLVTAVSSGIAERISDIYQLPRPALTIRNTPNFIESSFRPTGDTVRVLYHGIVSPGRGLEAAIDSVPKWASDREFYIRGPGSEDYLDSLRNRIASAGLQSRVFLLPPVPMRELVREAAAFDVGFFALPGHSLHNEFALPNKFFEYAMAGLALCVSSLSEMAGLIAKYQIGSTFDEISSEPIANAINQLSRDRIDRYKQNSLVAARELCWERESINFVAALNALVART
ncbi:glycosyltransferase involved in cell wall biosynthesis [Bradyrhizobium embrapense]